MQEQNQERVTEQNNNDAPPAPTIYEYIGGADTLRKLVNVFYRHVKAHPTLGPLFPEDIRPVREKQFMFMTQFFGGPRLYTDAYGPPMMRARHMPFPITPQRAAEWLGCMKTTLEEIGLPKPMQDLLLERLSGPAHHFVNSEDEN